MVKRVVKRTIKKTILGLLFGTIIFGVIILFAFSVKNAIPLLKIGTQERGSIIKPVSEFATLEDLSQVLSNQNIIMESLVESSRSSLFIGKIKDGPRVYFTKTRDAKWQVVSLELILKRLIINNKKPTFIDLRFDQPIVKF